MVDVEICVVGYWDLLGFFVEYVLEVVGVFVEFYVDDDVGVYVEFGDVFVEVFVGGLECC